MNQENFKNSQNEIPKKIQKKYKSRKIDFKIAVTQKLSLVDQ